MKDQDRAEQVGEHSSRAAFGKTSKSSAAFPNVSIKEEVAAWFQDPESPALPANSAQKRGRGDESVLSTLAPKRKKKRDWVMGEQESDPDSVNDLEDPQPAKLRAPPSLEPPNAREGGTPYKQRLRNGRQEHRLPEDGRVRRMREEE